MKRFSSLRIAVIADDLTSHCLSSECKTVQLTPYNYSLVFGLWKPDLVFVESAWKGVRELWKYRIASYPDHPKRNNRLLATVVNSARKRKIPTVFWNKEDGVHFDRFVGSAKLFDHIFTVDENCIARYRAVTEPHVTVNTLMFGVQPATHSFTGFRFKHYGANFVGSYSWHIHERRRVWQNTLFEAATQNGLPIFVFDRNSDRKSDNYRYPAMSGMDVYPAVPYAETAQIYKDYLVSLNVNTVEDSGTMFSRRLVEILACGGIAVTNPSPAVDRYFKYYCHVVQTAEEASDLFARLKYGPSREDLERAEAGARYVLADHTWADRLEKILDVVGIS